MFSGADYFRNLTVWVVQITEIHTGCRADRNTCGILPFCNPVHTESTFINVPVWMNITSIVRAGFDAGPTAYTFMVLYKYNPSSPILTGTRRTGSNTWCICTMITSFRSEFYKNIRVNTRYIFYYPISAISDWHIVFCLACNNTVAASHTLSGVYSHCVSHDSTVPGCSVKNVTKFPLIPVPPIRGSIVTRVIISASLAPFPKALVSFFSLCPNPCTI